MIAETRSYIFRSRSCCRRRRLWLSWELVIMWVDDKTVDDGYKCVYTNNWWSTEPASQVRVRITDHK